MKLRIFALALLGLIGGIACSMTLGASGQLEDGSEFFSGSATGYMNGSGTLTLTSKTGVLVNGEFVYINNREGSGTIKASDGRVGSFTFVSTGTNGTGTGTLGGKKFIFTFGGKPSSPSKTVTAE